MNVGTSLFMTSNLNGNLGSVDALLATRQMLPSGLSAPLPDNQWTLEVAWWFSIGLAGLQQSVVEYATGPSPEHVVDGLALPVSPIGDPNLSVTKTICNSQMIKSTGEYQNFSVLGLFCIMAIGGAIMLFSLNVESIVGFVQKKMDRGEEGRIRWIADSVFQLQRLMFEGRGYERWEGQKDVVPVYLGGDLQFPLERKDGTIGLKKRDATGQIRDDEDPNRKVHSMAEISVVPSRSDTAISLELLGIERITDQENDTKSTTETAEGSRGTEESSAENVLADRRT